MLLKTLPRMSRPHASLELKAWALMAVPMGVLTGGVAGVLANTLFAGTIQDWVLAATVAVLTGAGPLANMASVFWGQLSHGRAKVPLLNRLQALFGASLAVAALIPLNQIGLAVFVVLVLAAQTLWCGIITIRASIWRLNYSRSARTKFVGRNQVTVSVIGAATAAFTGLLLESNPASFRWILLATSACTFVSLAYLRAVRVRRHSQLLAAERKLYTGAGFSPKALWALLSSDRLYRQYMVWMMVLGSGNLMVTAPLILILTDNLGVSSFGQVLITAALPTVVVPFATPVWARVLAKHHVIRFRSLNSRWYAASIALLLAGVQLGSLPILWLGSIVLGFGIGGGMLGWNLGHNDFAPNERVAEYLGVHISLTGIRGLVAPLVGVGLYQLLESAQTGRGSWALALPLLLTSSGALGFSLFNRRLRLAGFPTDQPRDE